MKVRMDEGDPCRYIVSSESETGVEYIVDLCEYELGLDKETGIMEFNGVCGLTEQRIQGCQDFRYRCEPQLKKPENMGKPFRCKHLRASREFALMALLPYIKEHRPNTHEDLQA